MAGLRTSHVVASAAAVLAAGSLAYGAHVRDAAQQADRSAAAWRAEAQGWQRKATAAQAHDRRISQQNRTLVRSYNRLVAQTQAAQRQAQFAAQQQALQQAAAQATAAQQAAVQQAAPAVQAQPAQAPTSKAS